MKPNQLAVALARSIVDHSGCYVIDTGGTLELLAREYLKLAYPKVDWRMRRGGKKAPAKLAKKKGHTG